MTHAFKPLLAAALMALMAFPSHATCFADFKAKQDGPLRLMYGVIELQDPACTRPRQAERTIADRIAIEGWTLLTVLAIFGPEGLAERKDSAGPYFLRY